MSSCVYFSLAFKTGDRDLESRVEERLLLRLQICGCSDENKDQKHPDDLIQTPPQEEVEVGTA